MAPEFELPDQKGVIHKLSAYKGQWVLMYFYPKDDTPGCTKEACGIRDNYAAFKKMKIQVFGISKDSVKSHQKFVDKFELPFMLLADEEKEVCKKYSVLVKKSMFGREYIGVSRMSFLIDPKGKIAKVYEKVKPADHAEEVLNDVKELS